MANEISAQAVLTGAKNGQQVTGNSTKQITLAGQQLASGTLVVGTTTVQLAFPSDLTTEGVGYIWLRNNHATQTIDVGLNTPLTQKLINLKAGEVALFRPYQGNPTIYCLASGAATPLEWVAVGT